MIPYQNHLHEVSQSKDRVKTPPSDVSRDFLGTPFSAGGLGAAVMPPMGPWQSLSGGPGGKAPGSFWDLLI